MRFQLAGCLLVAVVIPYIVGAIFIPSFVVARPTEQALFASVAAILAGVWLYRTFSAFPGVQSSAYILPAFGAAYIVVLLVFLIGRLDYNRLLLISGFAGSVAWFYAISVLTVRQRRLTIGVVRRDETIDLDEVETIDWVAISSEGPLQMVDAVVADLRADLPDDWDRRLSDYALSGVPVYHVKQLRESLTGRVELEHLSENSLGTLTPPYAYFRAKQALDWLAALATLAVLAPFFACVAIAIRLDTPGPIIFRQKRAGYRGKTFTVYKFRTMTVADLKGHDAKAAAQTLPNDDRVTRIGRVLRKSRIDELPQIINILRGEMSWIGPRPEADVLSQWYEAEIPFYRYRHIVLPGITGWAQVNQGHVVDVSDITYKLHFDFYYIKHFSPWIDMLIIARTVQTVLTGFGHR